MFILLRTVPIALLPCCLIGQVSILTNRYDSSGTGANTRETILTASNVSPAGFGKLYSYPVDGSIYAQPLYVPDVKIAGRGERNVLYVATMNDKVYAFDADSNSPPLWMRDFTDESAGITPVPVVDITRRNDLNIVGNVGILGTPVIDSGKHAIYLLARTKENGAYVQHLHALDIRNGKDKHAPVVIQAQVSGTAKDGVNGVVSFNPKTGNQRPALAIWKNAVLIAWASHEDIQPYHGWVMAYDSKSLKQLAVLCTSANGIESGIWQSGRGPAIDSAGNIFYEIGNGDWDGTQQFGESLVKLKLEKKAFTVTDYYTPADWEALNKRDTDFGSTGPMLVPNTQVIICGDKKGVLTLLNAEDLGHTTPNDHQLLQAVPVKGGRVLNGPAYWDGPNGPVLYVWGEADFLKGYRLRNGTLEPNFYAKGTAGSHGSPGGALTVSANGSKAGTGIVWGMLTINKSADHGNAPGVLYAYDAENLQELWSSEKNQARDGLGTLVKFVPPVVANGKVYAATYDNKLVVYGLLH
ncbi:MAG: Fibronectin type domain [Bryobacterales bacterium]|nr:Fibronectin type domain [Bryobacterales bacterium]